MNLTEEMAAVYADAPTASATFWPGGEAEFVALGFFFDDPVDALNGFIPVGLAAGQPTLVCQSAAVASVWETDETPVTIAPDEENGIPGGSYTVVKKSPWGPGQSLLMLREV